MTGDKPINIDDAEFEEVVLKEEGVSVVDFWAPWCGPCHSMAPSLEAFTKANVGRVKVFKLDVDDHPKTAEKYEIKSVPTVIFFKNGVQADKVLGAMSESALQGKLDALLS
ncbi:MAG: thioredoxin [Pseudomonadota bacterium]